MEGQAEEMCNMTEFIDLDFNSLVYHFSWQFFFFFFFEEGGDNLLI